MSPNGDGCLVLVVEDDCELRDMMCELLKMSGFDALGCRDGREGLEAAASLLPSVVTLDLHMPGMDGVEVLDRLADDAKTADLPVVVVSAYASDRRIHSRDQVKSVIQKPFSIEELCQKVRQAANGH
jgi:two-component system, OmpR family, alkaline phosphatase synthesis response regulator PhoP